MRGCDNLRVHFISTNDFHVCTDVRKEVFIVLTIDQISNAAKIIAKEYPVIKIQLFGSYAEGKNTPESDVDILLEFDSVAVVTLLTLCRIKNRMEELLNVPVDVVTLPVPEDSIIEINKVVSLYAA